MSYQIGHVLISSEGGEVCNKLEYDANLFGLTISSIINTYEASIERYFTGLERSGGNYVVLTNYDDRSSACAFRFYPLFG